MLHAPAACRRIQGQYLPIVHQGFLASTARNMQDIQRRRIGQGRIRREPQSFQIANRRCGLAVDAISRIWDARQHLERPCQVNLIDALEQEGADVQVSIVRDHGHFQVRDQR